MIVEDRDDGRLTLASRFTGTGGEVIESNKARRIREAAGGAPLGSSGTGGSTTGGSDGTSDTSAGDALAAAGLPSAAPSGTKAGSAR